MKKLITALSLLTVTSYIAPLTVACDNKVKVKVKVKIKGELIFIKKITAEEILNVQKEYKYKDLLGKEITVTPDKLGSVDNNCIETLLEMNLSSIFMTKLTGIDQAKINDLNEYTIFNNAAFAKFSNKERQMITMYTVLKICAISFDIKSKSKDKKFTVTIEIKDKDKAFEKHLTMEQKVAIYFHSNKFRWILDANVEKNIVESMNNYNSVMQTINFSEVKSMYDLIKEKSATIEIDLTDKQ